MFTKKQLFSCLLHSSPYLAVFWKKEGKINHEAEDERGEKQKEENKEVNNKIDKTERKDKKGYEGKETE